MQQLRKLSNFTGYHLHASDGEIGKLKQVYIDDQFWVVRYFVVHTGSWLFGQDVLIVPSVIKSVDEENKLLEVELTREQIKNCPPVDTTLPVSRHYEQEYYRHYGLEYYWSGDSLLGTGEPYLPRPDIREEVNDPEHPHLRSSDEVKGYQIHAEDGEIGHVEDFILEEPGWSVPYLEVDTRNWLPGKSVLIAPAWIKQIDWAKKEVMVNLTRAAIQSAPEYDASRVISRDYQETLTRHYAMQPDKK